MAGTAGTVTVWWLPSERGYWIARGPNGGVVRIPNIREGWRLRVQYTGYLPPDDLAESVGIMELIAAVTGMPLARSEEVKAC